MDNHDNEFAQEISSAPKQQFYGLTLEGEIIALPEAPYANVALRLHAEACEGEGKTQPHMTMVFNLHQYRTILSAVDAELNDLDGDTFVPTYLIIPFANQLPVFPHHSVDTDEEAKEFIDGYAMEAVGPFKLTDVRDNWPKTVDPAPVIVEASAEVEPD
jgi:hypothetical protein